MGYNQDKDLIIKLLNTASINHKLYNQNDASIIFKSMAYFNIVQANTKENLLKILIENSNEWDFTSLSQICFSLSKLFNDNITVL